MRGLTPEEYAALSQMAGPLRMICDAQMIAVRDDLVEQGRAVLGAPHLEGSLNGYHLTPSGREALRLYPLMLALQAQP